MNRLHHPKLFLSIALTTLLLSGCGGGGCDSSPDVFTKCTTSGSHNADAPSSYRLFPLLAEGVEVDFFPGSHIAVTGTDNKGNALNGVHGEYIHMEDLLLDEETGEIVSEYRPITTYTHWDGSGEHAISIDLYFGFNIADPNAQMPFDDGGLHVYDWSGRDVFTNQIQTRGRTLLAHYFELIDSEPIPPTASPGDSGSLGTYMSGSNYTLERTWSLQNAKGDLAFLNIQSVLYRTANHSTVFEESLSYQIDEGGERQCVALYANDRGADFSIRMEGTLQETPLD